MIISAKSSIFASIFCFMFGKILSSPLKPVTTCGKSYISDVWHSFEFVFVTITYFCKTFSYFFTNILRYIKQYSIVHGQIHVNLSSTYLLKGYLHYQNILCHKVALDVQLMNFNLKKKLCFVLEISRFLCFCEIPNFKICDVI